MKVKKLLSLLVFAMFCLAIEGCTENELTVCDGVCDGVWLKMGDGSIVANSDINFYDISTHMIYLNNKVPFLQHNDRGAISVYVDDDEIYKCSLYPLYSSLSPNGAFILTPHMTNDIIRINFSQALYTDYEPTITDPRSDERIIAALKKNNQYHEGLNCTIQSVDVANGKVILNFELYNPDVFNYYYLDPDKMGIGLFHYFTNGLAFWNNQYLKNYKHQETVIYPEAGISWKKEWLTLIESGERKNISITYNQFDNIPSGQYEMHFSFPGLKYIAQKDLVLENGRIWLGSINVEKEITIF